MKNSIACAIAASSLIFGAHAAAQRAQYPDSDMAAAVKICRDDFRCIDHIQAAFYRVGLKKHLDGVDQAGMRVVSSQNMGAISQRNEIENKFDKYRKKLAGGGISESDCQLVIAEAVKTTAALEALARQYPPQSPPKTK